MYIKHVIDSNVYIRNQEELLGWVEYAWYVKSEMMNTNINKKIRDVFLIDLP